MDTCGQIGSTESENNYLIRKKLFLNFLLIDHILRPLYS